MDTLATLINKKLVILSQKTNYMAVEMRFMTQILKNMVGQIFVDEEWYTARYTDVVTAIQENIINSASEHYVLYGYYEHRMPYYITVDEDWYLTEYPDIQRAVQSRTFPSGQFHFEEVGYREGRVPFLHFQLRLHSDKS